MCDEHPERKALCAKPICFSRLKAIKPRACYPLPCKSRELRASELLGCTCTKRNGIQDDCNRRDCQGPRSCLISHKKPLPACCPSIYASRFENITMGRPTDPQGEHQIRVFENGARVIQYDPCLGVESKICKGKKGCPWQIPPPKCHC